MKSSLLDDILDELHLRGGALLRVSDCSPGDIVAAADDGRLYLGERMAFLLQRRRKADGLPPYKHPLTDTEQVHLALFNALDEKEVRHHPPAVQRAWYEGRKLHDGA